MSTWKNLFSDDPSSSGKQERCRLPGNQGRYVKQNAKRKYTSKRRFHGNQFSNKSASKSRKNRTSIVTKADLEKTVSCRKIKEVRPNKIEQSITGYRLLDMTILEELINCLLCPECEHLEGLCIIEDCLKRKGIASFISINCSNCSFTIGKYSSKTVTNKNIGKSCINNTFEVNLRAVYAMRSCGVGHKGLEKSLRSNEYAATNDKEKL